MICPKNIVLSLATFAICLVAPAGTASAQNWAEKMFEVTSHDFRTVGRGAKAEFHFKFKNIYRDTVHIAAVRTSCGCTTPSVTKDTIKSLETAAVVAKFNTDSFIGSKSATVTVVIDKPSYAEVRLQVEGFIRTDITFSPPEVQIGEIKSGATTAQEIEITKTGDRNWRITDVRSLCTDLSVRLSAPKVGPSNVVYKMTVTTKPTLGEGEIRERLTLVSNDRAFPTTEMSVTGRVRPALTVAPAALDMGTVDAGSAFEKKLVIRGDEPFAIKDVECADKRFSFEKQDGSKKIHFVTLAFDPSADPAAKRGAVAQKITIISDLGEGKSGTCSVTGIVE